MEFFTTFALAILALFVIYKGLFFLDVNVQENSAVIITKFGRIVKKLENPGGYFFPQILLPWYKKFHVSYQTQAIDLDSVYVFDSNGTMIQTELWIEYKVIDANKILFSIENWEESLRSSVVSETSKHLTQLTLIEILSSTDELERNILREIHASLTSWGINVSQIKIKNIRLSPDVQNQILQGVSAHLEKKKSIILESAKLRAQMIEAESMREVSTLQAESSVQMVRQVSAAYDDLKKLDSRVFAAYEELYRLSLVRPDRVIAFEGFNQGLTMTNANELIGNLDAINARFQKDSPPSIRGA